MTLWNPGITFVHVERAQEVLCLRAEPIGPRGEPMQVAVGPAERHLDNVVDLIKEQIRRQLQATPQRRISAHKIDPHPVGHHIAATRPSRRRGRALSQVYRSTAVRLRPNAVLRPPRQATDR